MEGFFQVPAGGIRGSVPDGGVLRIGGGFRCRWSGSFDQQNRPIQRRYGNILPLRQWGYSIGNSTVKVRESIKHRE